MDNSSISGYAVIRPSDPTGALVEQITFKNLIAAYGFRGWSVDGKGIYVQELTSSGMVLLCRPGWPQPGTLEAWIESGFLV